MNQAEPGTSRGGARVWASRPLRLSAVLAVVAPVWFVAQLAAGPIEPVIAGWLIMLGSATLTAVLCRQTARSEAVRPAARRFWWLATVALIVFGVSTVSRIADSTNADLTMTTRLGLLSAALHAVTVALLLWPLCRLPLGITSSAQRAAFWLDISTLMICATVFLWHFAGPDVGSHAGGMTLVAGLALMVGSLLGVFVVAKVALTGAAFIHRDALRALGVTLALAGFGSALSPQLVTLPYLDTSLLIVPVGCFLIGLGARLEATAGAGPDGRAPRARRRYSLTPYAAVAATGVLLVVTIAQDSPDRLLVACAGVALGALVIVRQITAFREIDALVNRLDSGMLALRDSERRFRLLVQNSTDVVTISGVDGMVRYISPAVRRVLGREPGEILDADLAPLVHPDDHDIVASNLAHVVAQPGNSATFQARLAHSDGSWRWLEVISVNLLDEPGVAGIVSNSRDFTETREVQQRLTYEASHDALTGLANRTLFTDRLQASIAAAGPADRISVVLVDLDDFKTVNDTLGHAVGDALLVHVAERMRAGIRPTDMVARLGGDEFAIIFENLGDEALDQVLGRIAEALAEPTRIDGEALSVRASFGVVDVFGGDADAVNLMRQADIAMYDAKERGDGGHQRYRAGMEARGAERSRHAAALRTALDEDQLVLHYQPVVTLPEGRITGVEALLRWQHPTQGLLGPGAFIDAAEETGLIVPLGRWVLREATRQAAAWLDEYGDVGPVTISVNASARQLREPDFATEVGQALRDSGLPAHRLTIEITESTAVGGGATQDTLRRLRGMGVRLSLDDFGTGASTLSLLATCPVDQIKLDRSFAPVPGPDAIATAVVQLAKAFGVEAVAEGVETPAQAAKLESLGYLRAQGFHFARPMAPDQLTTELAARLAVRP